MKKTKKTPAGLSRNDRLRGVVFLCAALVLVLARLWAAPAPVEDTGATEYAEYETGKVTQVLTDSTEPDPTSDGAWRGEQLLLVEVSLLSL